MACWLIKTEPGSWSWDDQVREGVTHWDGVRNYQASNNMKAMRIGDRVFFYHSIKEKLIVGIVEISREYYPDPSDASARFGMVDVTMLMPMNKPVSLADMKAEPKLQELSLIRQSRLSVMPIDDESWALICRMGETVA